MSRRDMIEEASREAHVGMRHLRHPQALASASPALPGRMLGETGLISRFVVCAVLHTVAATTSVVYPSVLQLDCCACC